MRTFTSRTMRSLMAIGLALAATGAQAQETLESIGKPVPNGTGFQPAATELMRDIHFLDNFLLIISVAIVLFVVGLLAVVIFRFNAKANPTPQTFTHNPVIEVVWTIVPVLILIVIGAVSLPLLFKQLEVPEPELTIKATGNQWYWSYLYPDEEIEFDAVMLTREELDEAGYAPDEYLLATDEAVVLPVDTVVHVLVQGADVIHSWTIPAFGVKVDAVPNRLNELWFKAEREGIYFGQCSELCGKDHSYMPITVKVVSKEAYATWLEDARVRLAVNPIAPSIDIAAAAN